MKHKSDYYSKSVFKLANDLIYWTRNYTVWNDDNNTEKGIVNELERALKKMISDYEEKGKMRTPENKSPKNIKKTRKLLSKLEKDIDDDPHFSTIGHALLDFDQVEYGLGLTDRYGRQLYPHLFRDSREINGYTYVHGSDDVGGFDLSHDGFVSLVNMINEAIIDHGEFADLELESHNYYPKDTIGMSIDLGMGDDGFLRHGKANIPYLWVENYIKKIDPRFLDLINNQDYWKEDVDEPTFDMTKLAEWKSKFADIIEDEDEILFSQQEKSIIENLKKRFNYYFKEKIQIKV